MKILEKTYDNADFRKNLKKFLRKKLRKNLGKTYDHCRAVFGSCEIDYTVVTSTITTTMVFILS